MKKYILDASVILTFLLGKNQALEKKFIKILKQAKAGRAKLYSTYLLPLEIGNGTRYSLSDKDLASEVFLKFSRLPIELSFFTTPQLLKILRLGYLYNTSFYDSSYHFLAKFLKGVFLTADREYFQKAKKLGQIELL